MMTKKLWTLLCGALLLVAAGCKEEAVAPPAQPPAQPTAPTPAAPAAAPNAPGAPASAPTSGAAVDPSQAPQMPAAGLTGKVVETMNASGYTYMNVQAGQSSLWVASSPVEVKVGDTVDVPPGLIMTNFTSKSLNRTFPQIFFVNGVRVNGQGAMPVPPPMPAGVPMDGLHGDGQPASAPGSEPSSAAAGAPNDRTSSPQLDLTGIIRAEGGQTVAELHRDAEKLNGKPIKVRGKVIKFLGGIMGRNWLHIQDGTGSAADGSHDLTVTSEFPFKRGDTVVVEGTLTTNKDFGQGYFYKLIVENGKIAIENQ
jgi:hypothetical protein